MSMEKWDAKSLQLQFAVHAENDCVKNWIVSFLGLQLIVSLGKEKVWQSLQK